MSAELSPAASWARTVLAGLLDRHELISGCECACSDWTHHDPGTHAAHVADVLADALGITDPRTPTVWGVRLPDTMQTEEHTNERAARLAARVTGGELVQALVIGGPWAAVPAAVTA